MGKFTEEQWNSMITNANVANNTVSDINVIVLAKRLSRVYKNRQIFGWNRWVNAKFDERWVVNIQYWGLTNEGAFEWVFQDFCERIYPKSDLGKNRKEIGHIESMNIFMDTLTNIATAIRGRIVETSIVDYLMTSTRNAFKNWIKEKKKGQDFQSTDDYRNLQYNYNFAENFIQRDLIEKIEHYLEEYENPERRELFYLRWKDDIDFKEIAIQLNTQLNTDRFNEANVRQTYRRIKLDIINFINNNN